MATALRAPFFCALFFCAIATAHADTLPRPDGSTIHFYLTPAPETAIPHQVLLLILQGSDCNSVKNDGYIHGVLAKALPGADVLTVEKIGITAELSRSDNAERSDCPPIYIERDNPSQRVADLVRVLRHVLAEHNYQKFIVIGGSEGATVAAMLASRDLPDAVVLLNPGGRYFLDDVLHNIRTTSGEKMEEDLAGFREFAAQIKQAEPFPIEMSNHGFSWWRQMLDVDQQNLLERAICPVLIVQGGQDKSVSPSAAQTMANHLRAAGKNNIEIIFYENLDHGLIAPDGGNHSERVVADIKNWLKVILAPAATMAY